MKRSSVTLSGGCALLFLPVAAFASTHGSPASGGTGGAHGTTANYPVARSSIGIKYNGPNSGTPFSTFIRGERIGVFCPTDRQCLLVQLRNQGLALKEKDGGKLTPEHKAELQAQLDAINARYH